MYCHELSLYHHNRFFVSRQWIIAQTFLKNFPGSKILFVSLHQFYGKIYVILLNFSWGQSKISRNLLCCREKVCRTAPEAAVSPSMYMAQRGPGCLFFKKRRKLLKVPGVSGGMRETIGLGYRGEAGHVSRRAPSKRRRSGSWAALTGEARPPAPADGFQNRKKERIL